MDDLPHHPRDPLLPPRGRLIGHLLRFAILRRRPRLYRCPECISVTDQPQDHAAMHAGRPANPSRSEGERFLDVIVDDTIDRCMASPLHGSPLDQPPAPPDPEPIYHGERRR